MKKTILGLLICLLFLVTSCNSVNKQEVPDGVIPYDEMIDIMVDVWILESTIHIMLTNYDLAEPATVTMYAQFFEEHGITKEQFVKSAEYYMQPGQNSEAFIQECIQRLEKRKAEFTGDTIPASQPQ